MSQRSTLLLEHHLKELKLPSFLREYGKVAAQCAAENADQPDFVMLTNEQMNDSEIEDFYRRWEARFRGPAHAHRPAIASFVRDIKTLGLSHREMDFIQSLRWSLEEVSRAYGVPRPLLSDLERATFSNVNAAERFFWRNTMVPEMTFLAERGFF